MLVKSHSGQNNLVLLNDRTNLSSSRNLSESNVMTFWITAVLENVERKNFAKSYFHWSSGFADLNWVSSCCFCSSSLYEPLSSLICPPVWIRIESILFFSCGKK